MYQCVCGKPENTCSPSTVSGIEKDRSRWLITCWAKRSGATEEEIEKHLKIIEGNV
jgi:hypothetical protein